MSETAQRQPSAIQEFLRSETAGGVALIAASAVALGWANSPAAELYELFRAGEMQLQLGPATLATSLRHVVNDGLMALFFLLVSIEIKRELLVGALSSPRRAALPFIAAAGGMLVPALIYVAVARAEPGALRGWAIPAATDIAFALAALALVARSAPPALRLFLAALAIIDDLGAILIIALFYSGALSLVWLSGCAALLVVLGLLNRAAVRQPAAYLLPGFLLWVCLLNSGIHATMAGVLLAAALPLRETADRGGSAGRRIAHALRPVVSFLVLPAFGLINAGLSFADLTFASLLQPIPLGVTLALFFGKQVGVFGAAWLCRLSGLATLPEGVTLGQFYGVALLCGIGFTMSLFIAGLAFPDDAREDAATLGILLGSLLSALCGTAWLRASGKGQRLRPQSQRPTA